jgi:hypothetical protein
MTVAGRSAQFYYVPASSPSPEYVVGRIGKKLSISEHTPPDIGLQEIIRESWQASLIILDPKHHEDGQKIAIEEDARVGNPTTILTHIANFLNQEGHSRSYFFEFEPIFQGSSFWEFASKHRGRVSRLTFSFVTPNMFGVKNEIDEALRSMRRDENVTRVEFTLRSPAGVNTDTARVRHSVEYAERGGGHVTARAKTGERYDSKAAAVTTALPAPTESAAGSLPTDPAGYSAIMGRN